MKTGHWLLLLSSVGAEIAFLPVLQEDLTDMVVVREDGGDEASAFHIRIHVLNCPRVNLKGRCNHHLLRMF